mgnify:CR=1 FL=1
MTARRSRPKIRLATLAIVIACFQPVGESLSAGQRAGNMVEERCWGKGPELANADGRPRRFRPLPTSLARHPVTRQSVVLKLCVDRAGGVARALMVTSSGDKEVDQFFQNQALRWEFRPLVKDGNQVSSVVRVGSNWNTE